MMAANSNTSAFDEKGDSGEEEYVTVAVADQMFGLAIDQVHDVFIASSLTTVPLAPREIVGLLNLRGRVVTAMCLRRRLGLPDRAGGKAEMAVGLEHQGEILRAPRRRGGRGHAAFAGEPRTEPGPHGRALAQAVARRPPA
jgi:purine-binding chemotaxis protein CheW